MRVIGIDPGTAITGYGIIDAVDGELHLVTYGVIRTDAHTPLPERLLRIYEDAQQLLDEYRPETAGIEEVFFGRNITTALSVGQARGVLMLALVQAGISIAEYSPPKIKDTVTGYGKADKQQVQLMVRNLLGLAETPRPDDAADGIAVAITHYHHHRYAALTQNQQS